MRYLVISDLHLGDRRFCQVGKLMSVLDNEQYDHLILAGDIIDRWLDSDGSALAHIVINRINRISHDKPLTFLAGNHEMVGDWQVAIKAIFHHAEIAERKEIRNSMERVVYGR
jgi:UDP-2,3-diacylglucosamine pyrophosphatase LpxH